MTDKTNAALNTDQLAKILDKVPAGITVIDKQGHILYYNEYCAKYVDRKPEYIGENIAFCHKKSESMVKIKAMLSKLDEGKEKTFYYEAQRGESKLGVTVTPFEIDGKQIGFIQCFSIIHE